MMALAIWYLAVGVLLAWAGWHVANRWQARVAAVLLVALWFPMVVWVLFEKAVRWWLLEYRRRAGVEVEK